MCALLWTPMKRTLRNRPRSFLVAITCGAALAVAGLAHPAHAQTARVVDANLQRRADAVLGLMGFMLTPDVTTGSLALADVDTGNPNLAMTTLGGGFTYSNELPVYLEGTAGYARYDPVFVFSDGSTQRGVPVKWNAFSLTGGIGWDFRITDTLVLRPIFNFSRGRVLSDSQIAGILLQETKDADLEFLNDGRMNTYGVGSTLMLDYERYADDHEIDVELRYTDIHLSSESSRYPAVRGSSDARSLSVWSRWRAPTGLTALDAPVRYVLEGAQTRFLADLKNALGFSVLNSVGVGLELDSSERDIVITRTRLILRYKFGDNVRGTSIGLACSF